MTREEKYPELRQFADEYIDLCRKYQCTVADTDYIGIVSFQEAIAKRFVTPEQAKKRFESSLKNVVQYLAMECGEDSNDE